MEIKIKSLQHHFGIEYDMETFPYHQWMVCVENGNLDTDVGTYLYKPSIGILIGFDPTNNKITHW